MTDKWFDLLTHWANQTPVKIGLIAVVGVVAIACLFIFGPGDDLIEPNRIHEMRINKIKNKKQPPP